MNNSNSHIVFLTPGFAESEEDSTTIPAMQVYLKALKELKPELKITIISFQFPFKLKPYKWFGIQVIPLNGKNNTLKKLFIWKKATKLLNQINQNNPISVIHSFWIGECSLIGQFFSIKNNIKHIVTAMGQDVFKNKYALFLKKEKSKIITLTENHHNELYKNYNLNSEIIPWTIFIDDFPEIKKNEIDILGVGSLNKIKNYNLFISIIYEIVKYKPKLAVEIIGEGKEYLKIEKLIKKFNLQKNIAILGKLSRDKVLEKMSKSKILLHTSNYESFGYVFAEALYSGMKIVSYDVGASKIIPQWKICLTNEDIIESCLAYLTVTESSKYRILLNKQTETLQCYLKLYYE